MFIIISFQLFPHVVYLNNSLPSGGQLLNEDSDTDSEWGSSVATSDLDSLSDSDCDWHDFDNIPLYLPELARFMSWS